MYPKTPVNTIFKEQRISQFKKNIWIIICIIEFLAANPEVLGLIPGSARFSE
jgi:hypothetical protein